MEEEIIDVVTAYESGGRDSLVVAIPRRLRTKGIGKGTRFLVKLDQMRRLIYEPIPEEAQKVE